MPSGDIYLGQQWLLAAPTHYLNQCWLIISEVLWHSHDGNFIENAQHISPWYDLLLIKDYLNICHIVESEMSQKMSWRDLFVQIELGMDIASLGIK